MDENIQSYTKEQCAEWLKEIGQTATGTVEQLQCKIEKFRLYPKLLNRLKSKARRSYSFKCSLDPLKIPNITAHWSTDESLYPTVTEEMFYRYCSLKRQGSMGQQEKAFRMLQSRKIVSVKVLSDSPELYVKAMIKKSYGTQLRPAVVYYNGLTPEKAHCSCPVGASGLCCHVLALLLFLKHYRDTKEKILELTCTQQLQKWHRRTKKGSIPMIPLKDIKAKSAKMKKTKDGKMVISPADSSNAAYFKRDVSSIINNLKEQLKKEKPIEEHMFGVLMNSECGKKSSVGQHLNYKFNLKSALALADHDYCKVPLFNPNIISIDPGKINNINYYINNQYSTSHNKEICNNKESNIVQDIIKQNDFEIVIEKTYTVYQGINHTSLHKNIDSQFLSGAQVIKLDLSYLVAPKPCGSNYYSGMA